MPIESQPSGGGGTGGFSVVDYAERTTNLSVTATTEGTAQTIVTGTGFTADGTSFYRVEFFAPDAHPDTGASHSLNFVLFDGATPIGTSVMTSPSAGTNNMIVFGIRRVQPSAGAHTYKASAYVDAGTGVVGGGPGTSGNVFPAYIMVTKLA